MLVVMGIIIVFIAMAVPVVRSLMGSSSIAMARNSLAALLTRAREEAVGMQDVRGVLFVLDRGTDRVVGMIVQPAAIQDSGTSVSAMSGLVLLDLVPKRDSMTLPAGVRLQTVFN